MTARRNEPGRQAAPRAGARDALHAVAAAQLDKNGVPAPLIADGYLAGLDLPSPQQASTLVV